MTAPYYAHNYIGEYANDTLADANVNTRGWTLSAGIYYYNTTDKVFKYYDGTYWTDYTAEWPDGNITYVPLTKTGLTQTQIIANAVTDATAGDTLVLASGTYTITSKITINKALNITGQGASTLITCSAAVDTFLFTANDVRFSDLSLTNTGAGTASITVANNLTGIIIRNCQIISSGTGVKWGVYIRGSNVNLLNLLLTVSSSTSRAYGLYIDNIAATTQNITVNVLDVVAIVSGSGGSGGQAFYVENNNDPDIITVNMWNSTGVSIPSAGTDDSALELTSTTTNTIVANAYHCTFNGADYDVQVTNPNIANLYGCVLANGTTNRVTGGIINYVGTLVTDRIVSTNASTETVRFLGNGVFTTDLRVDGAWIAPAACTIVRVVADTAERGKNDGSVTSNIWDVNLNGVTMYTTQANRPTIATSAGGGETYVVATLPDIVAVAQNDRITIDTDAVANGTIVPTNFTIILRVVY